MKFIKGPVNFRLIFVFGARRFFGGLTNPHSPSPRGKVGGHPAMAWSQSMSIFSPAGEIAGGLDV